MPSTPQLSWAQRKGTLYITVEVVDPEDVKVEFKEKSISASCKVADVEYSLDLELYAPVNVEECRWAVARKLEMHLTKKDEDTWPRLQAGEKKLSNIKVDWGRWADSDDEEAKDSAFDMSNFDMSSLGGMGGMGGMPGMGGMGGMPGMEGMDFGGMGGDFDNMDFGGEDEEEEDENDEEPGNKEPAPAPTKAAVAEPAAPAECC